MKKYLLSILFLSVFCKLSFAGAISVQSFISADDVTIEHLETQRSTFQGAINAPDGGLIQAGTITDTSMDDNTSPVNRWDETFNDFVYTGLVIPTSADLNSTTTAGTAYVQGYRVVKDATPHLYTASKDTYVDLSKTGTYTYTPVVIGTTAPDTADNSIRLAKVVTNTTVVLSVTDLRVTTVTQGTGSDISLVDTDQDTQVQVEKNADEDIIRFDTAGTERMTIGATGIVNIANLTASKPVFTDGSKNLVSTGTLATDQGGTGATAAANAANGAVVLDANSKISVAQLGAWVDKSASYGAQQAATDGFVVATSTSVNDGGLAGYTDASADPTTLRVKDVKVATAGGTSYAGVCFPVKKGDYWKIITVTGITAISVYWIPLGS